MKKQVVGHDRRTDQPHDEEQIPSTREPGHQQAVDHAGRPGREHHGGGKKGDGHHRHECHQNALHESVSAGPQEAESRNDQSDDRAARVPAEHRFRAQGSARQVSRLEGRVPDADGGQHEPRGGETRQRTGKPMANRLSEARPGHEAEPRRHLLKHERCQHGEQESPEKRHAMFGARERRRRHRAGSDERRSHDGARADIPEGATH